MQDENFTPCNFAQLRKALAQYFSSPSFLALAQYFSSPSFMKERGGSMAKELLFSSSPPNSHNPDSKSINLIIIPSKDKDICHRAQYESCISALWKLQDQVLSMKGLSFARTVSERDWLKNSAKILELVKRSAIIAEYGQSLQSSGMFRS